MYKYILKCQMCIGGKFTNKDMQFIITMQSKFIKKLEIQNM